MANPLLSRRTQNVAPETGSSIPAGKNMQSDRLGFKTLAAGGLIAATVLLDGIDANLIALVIPSVSKEWHVSPSSFAGVTAAATASMMIGSAVAGWLTDRIGQRLTLILANLVFGVGTLLGALVDNHLSLGATRILAGLGLGAALPTAIVAMAEVFPERFRGPAITVAALGMPVGGILAGLMASIIIGPWGWRSLLLAGGIMPIALALLYIFTLRSTSPSAVDADDEGEKTGSFRAILAPALRRDTLLVWCGFFASLFASYAILSWLPALFTRAGSGPVLASASISNVSIGSLIGALAAPWLVYRLGTRTVMAGAAVVAAVFSILVALLFDRVGVTSGIMVALALIMVGLGSLNSTFYALTPSLYPRAIRGTGIGIALAVGRLGVVASAFGGAWALEGGGARFFGMIAIAVTVALVSFGLVSRHDRPAIRR